jgi:hypothetical protein
MLTRDKKRSLSRAGGAIILGILILAGASSASLAKEALSIAAGKSACDSWCEANNPEGNGRNKCFQQCDIYWECNGSNSTAHSCQFIKQAYGVKIQAAPTTNPASGGTQTPGKMPSGLPATPGGVAPSR